MELEYAFFADTAAVPPDRKLYVLGGGFSTIALPHIPGQATFAVVAGFRFGEADVGKTHQVEMRFVDDAGKFVIPPVNLQFQSAGQVPASDVEISVPTVAYVNPTFGEPGRYAAEFWSGDRLLAQVRLRVEEQVQGAAGPMAN
ncbi:MAG TPA: hypothetical protein VG266_09205 [Candidatus Dormibacteraeota bacterium]|jgi:hypothetical protein|nr:hypothetical protein [Candidatus Dormibacteraeota bacterium]